MPSSSTDDMDTTTNESARIEELEAALAERDRHINHLTSTLSDRDDRIAYLKERLDAVIDDHNQESGRCGEARREKKLWADHYKWVVESIANLRASAKAVVRSLATGHQVDPVIAQWHMQLAINGLEEEVKAYDERTQ